EIEAMLTDVMFIRDGALILHVPTAEIPATYTQVLVRPDAIAAAAARGPIFTETRFGQTVMFFAGVPRQELESLGQASTPTLSDLFVALMTPPQEGAP